MPERVQMTRHKPWRSEHPFAIIVTRMGQNGFGWGNPFKLIEHGGEYTRSESLRLYREALLAGELDYTVADVRDQLAGSDLACWCPLDVECHADVLLEIANGGAPAPALK